MKRNPYFITAVLFALSMPALCLAAIAPEVVRHEKGVSVRFKDREKTVFSPIPAEGCFLLHQPGQRTSVVYEVGEKSEEGLALTGGKARNLSIRETLREICPGLFERVVTVTAESDERYFIDFGWKTGEEGTYYSFQSEEKESKSYSPGCSGPEFTDRSSQTFPFVGVSIGNQLYGLVGDSPGHWENRCFLNFDLERRTLSLANGDGSPKRTLLFPHELDSTSVYRGEFDGWQHIERGESQSWTTWIFSSPAHSHYDIQLAAHLALANAKGFNRSGLEAILRNTSYILLRRNLLRPESDYIFISGVGYGWKQWVTDGFYMSRGLDDPELDAHAHAAAFFERINYEDNAQVYLIWAALVKRASGELDMRTVKRAYHFIRNNEKDGLFFPPRLNPESAAFRTYMDVLEYEDGDPPSSNQGFHCGALLAARELGFEVSDGDIEKAKAGYLRMFNPEGGYMATSLKRQHHIGQDALYGAALTYAVFGEKLLPDEVAKTHMETTYRLQSPYGMRVISKADGELLDGHSGSYVFGGSWFLVDGANYLVGLIHGMDPEDLDRRLLWRLEKELAYLPAFHESINTLTGKPHGHHLYSWNSGFWWLRQQIRHRLGLRGEDPLDSMLDQKLGIGKVDGFLVLLPEEATLRPPSASE